MQCADEHNQLNIVTSAPTSGRLPNRATSMLTAASSSPRSERSIVVSVTRSRSVLSLGIPVRRSIIDVEDGSSHEDTWSSEDFRNNTHETFKTRVRPVTKDTEGRVTVQGMSQTVPLGTMSHVLVQANNHKEKPKSKSLHVHPISHVRPKSARAHKCETHTHTFTCADAGRQGNPTPPPR